MSQLPPPNFGNFPSAFNMNGFPGWQMGTTAPSIFGRPQSPLLGFPLRLPMNPIIGYPGSQFRPGMWPNVNFLRPQLNHVVAQNHSSMHEPLQATNFQEKPNGTAENGQTCHLNKDYSCDACQRDFTSKETLNAHLISHVQCSYEGCTFKAGRKVLKLHWIQTHETGRMRIKLDTPEDIAKWREERKRKYPTVANVERKMAEEAKRKASGHVLKTKKFRYRRGRHGGRTFQQGGHNHFDNRGQTRKGVKGSNAMGVTKTLTMEQIKDEDRERKSEDPTILENGEDPLSLVLDGSLNEEDESGSGFKKKLSAQEILSSPAGPSNVTSGSSALGSLCSAYASDSEDGQEPTEIINNQPKDCSPNEKDTKKSMNEPKVGCAVIRHPVKHLAHKKTKRPRRRSRKNISKANSKSTGIRKSTLLEKLLAPEVRHERNVILQCLRHIVKKNFFDIGETHSPLENIVKKGICDDYL